MTRIIRQANREKTWVRIRLLGASNSGKTFGSLCLALGLTGGQWIDGRPVGGRMEHVCVVDTEKERSRLFAPAFGNRFDVLPLDPPFSPERYIEAVREAQHEGAVDGEPYEVIIIDSGTHEWAGEGGVLQESDRLKKSARDKQYEVWGNLTPRHQAFIEACIIRPSAHVIFCTRAKGEYDEIVDANGRKKRVKVGIQDIQREGLEFEFTFGFRLEGDHMAYVEKDTSFLPKTGGSLFDGHPPFVLSADTGRKIIEWLDGGAGSFPVSRPTSDRTSTQSSASGPVVAPLNGVVGSVSTATSATSANDDQALRAELLGLFKTALKTDERKKLVDALAKASKAILPNEEVRESYKNLSRLEADTILQAVKRSPDAETWYDIAQGRVIPKPTPSAPATSLFGGDQPSVAPMVDDLVIGVDEDEEPIEVLAADEIL